MGGGSGEESGGTGQGASGPRNGDEEDVADLLDRAGFDADASVLTRRQAVVLALRERGETQATIAERLGTSRPNVAKVEGSARRNVERARETVDFAEALQAPVRVAFDPGTHIYDVPDAVYAAGDDADVRVAQSAPDLIKRVSDAAGAGVTDGTLHVPVLVSVTAEGVLRVRVGGD